jgi:hypothetical protein
MEITSFGGTCLRLRGREGAVAADAFASVVGPTGRGLTAEVATYSHADDQPTLGLRVGGRGRAKAKTADNGRVLPASLASAFVLDSPGEFEVRHILINGVATFRDDAKGAERGRNTCFVYELDGLHAAHLGDIGHLLSEEMVEELGPLDVACVPVGGALPAARTAELVAQLDAKLIVAMPLGEVAGGGGEDGSELGRFLHEMSVQHPEPVAKLQVSFSSLPQELTVVLLEPRARA